MNRLTCLLLKAFACILHSMTVVPPSGQLCAQETQTPMTFMVIVDVSGSMLHKFPAPTQPVLADSTKLVDVKRRLALLADHLPAETRVIVTRFDHESFRVCDLVLSTVDEREELRRAFASLESRNGSTHLWSVADKQLAIATKIAESQPEGRVRVLLYTDGKDEENPPVMDHHTIIDKYGDALQSVVTLDWVTLGYDLKADVKAAFESQGVNFTKAVKPEDIVPLKAAFRLSPDSIEVGDEVRLIDDSLGVEIDQRVVDWGDHSPYQTGKDLRHTYEKRGKYRVRYLIKTASGKESQASDTITVTNPEPPVAQFELDRQEVTAGEPVIARNTTAGEGLSLQWDDGSDQQLTSPQAKFLFEKPGKATISLTVTDAFGQSASTQKSITVREPAAPTADFRFSPATVEVGDVITIINESGPTVARQQWTLPDGSRVSERHATMTAKEVGEQHVTLEVWDRFGQSSSVTKEVKVASPPPPQAGLVAPQLVQPGENVSLLDRSAGAVNGNGEWFVDGKAIGAGETVDFRFETPGRYTVRRRVVGPGGADEAERLVEVADFKPPKPGFTIGTDEPFLGDSVTVTSTATGPIDTIIFHISGIETPITLDATSPDADPSFTYVADQVGKVAVEQLVAGPGGDARLAKNFVVSSRSIQPKALIRAQPDSGRGPTEIRFTNESTGSVLRTVYDFGDGTEPVAVEGAGGTEHSFMPGEWRVKVAVHGPDDTVPDTWDETITIHEPIAGWIRQLVWQVPSGFFALIAGGWLLARYREKKLIDSLALLHGSLTVYPTGKIRQSKQFEFDGSDLSEEVAFDESTRVRVESLPDEADDGVIYRFEVERASGVPQSVVASSGEEVSLAGLTVCYTS